MGFVVILHKYEILLKKLLAMSIREVIWAMIFDSLLEVMIPIDEEEIWTMTPPLEVKILWAM